MRPQQRFKTRRVCLAQVTRTLGLGLTARDPQYLCFKNILTLSELILVTHFVIHLDAERLKEARHAADGLVRPLDLPPIAPSSFS